MPAFWRALARPMAAGLLAALLTACAASAPAATPTAFGPGPTEPPEQLQADLAALPAGSAASGMALFTSVGCVACHSLVPNVRVVGPSLAGVATRAPTRKTGYTAQMYLYESITEPNAYVVDTFPSGVMPQDFRKRLKPQDLADLIAFFMTQK